MPVVYLSPSTQEKNYFVSGGTEEQYSNLLADAMVPYLDASGIQYQRNTPDMTAASSIAASNAGTYDLHLALHSNAAPEDRYGQVRGSILYYFPDSKKGRRACTILADGLRAIYPIPNLVQIQPTTAIGEVRRVRAPSAFLELAYHDNTEDAAWIKGNLAAIARNLAISLTEYFGLPFFESQLNQAAQADITWGVLNIRERPDLNAPILLQVPDQTALTVVNAVSSWALVRVSGTTGYAREEYITRL